MSNRFSKHSDAIREETHSDIYLKGYNHGHWHQPIWEYEDFNNTITRKEYKEWLEGYHRGYSHRSLDNW